MNLEHMFLYTVTYFGLFTSLFFLLTLYENKHKIKNPKLTHYPTVTIAVPAFNEEKTILKTIKSLLNLDYPINKLKIIVIDDGSTDNTYSIAKSITDPRLIVYTKKNGGKGSALNFAIQKSKTEFFGALDADSFVDSKSLKKMIGFFSDLKVAAVTPSMRVYNPQNILQKIQYIEYLIGIYLRKIFAFLGAIHVTPGPFSIYRKSFFDKYGGYDENNLTEDIEIALRIQSNNLQIENSVDASVFTVSPDSFKTLFKQRIRWYVGFIQNIIDYKKLFSLKYGNLGFFVLPGSFLSVFLIITTLFYVIYKLITVSIIQNFKNYSSIGFDITKLFEFSLDTFFINLDPITLLMFLSLLIGISLVLLAKKIAKDKTSISSFYLCYFFVYWAFFGFWWLASIFYIITGRKIIWGNKQHG